MLANQSAERSEAPQVGSPALQQTGSLRYEASASGSNFTLTWLALAGRSYQLQFTTNLTQTNWSNVGSPIAATNTSVTASDTIGANPQRHYRIVLLP